MTCSCCYLFFQPKFSPWAGQAVPWAGLCGRLLGFVLLFHLFSILGLCVYPALSWREDPRSKPSSDWDQLNDDEWQFCHHNNNNNHFCCYHYYYIYICVCMCMMCSILLYRCVHTIIYIICWWYNVLPGDGQFQCIAWSRHRSCPSKRISG